MILEKNNFLVMRLTFLISTKFMKSHIDRKFNFLTLVGSDHEKRVKEGGGRGQKKEFVSNSVFSGCLHGLKPKPFHIFQ